MINDLSPFHVGEQKIQTKLGVRENMERFGRMVIRDHMPEQHREFYQQIPFIFLGHEDPSGNPWASILFGESGFIRSSSNQSLRIDACPVNGDPLKTTLLDNERSQKATKIGVLGIELPTRRRNRLAAHVTSFSNESIELEVDQSFGNCPQYIQSRHFSLSDKNNRTAAQPTEINQFDNTTGRLIESSDTFFIASAYDSGNNHASDGADVSHRGGKPGFVKVIDQQRLIIPDYLGNNHFNTFGNIQQTGKAGLLFIDFESGDLLTLSGKAEVDWDSDEIGFFEGAQRLLKFELSKGYLIKSGITGSWSQPEYSPNTSLTGTWDEAEQLQNIEIQRNQWLGYRVDKIISESDSIQSFYLVPVSGQLFKFQPGQFLTIRVKINGKYLVRTYTVSSVRSDGLYRISIKKEVSEKKEIPDGIVSNYMHQGINVGDVIEAKAPSGSFFFETRKQKPALLVAAGIGITPMVAMLRQIQVDAIKTRYLRRTTLIAIVRSKNELAFYHELNKIADQSQGQINIYWCITQPERDELLNQGFHIKGRPSEDLYRAVIENKRTDAFLCGPAKFMQQTYDTLRKIGLSDTCIHAESFGPSALKRDNQKQDFKLAQNASIVVQNERGEIKIEQQWSDSDGTLLEFLESHGVQPEYGCRSGQCGSCKVKLIGGRVGSTFGSTAPVGESEVLLCCSKPKEVPDSSLPIVTIQLSGE